MLLIIPSKHDALNQCWFDDGPASQMVGQHWASIGSSFRVCWVNHHLWFPRRCDPPLYTNNAQVDYMSSDVMMTSQYTCHKGHRSTDGSTSMSSICSENLEWTTFDLCNGKWQTPLLTSNNYNNHLVLKLCPYISIYKAIIKL